MKACEYQEGDLIWALYQGEDGCDKLEGEVVSTALYAEHQKIQIHIYDNGSAEVVWAGDVEPRHSGYYLWGNKQVWDRGNALVDKIQIIPSKKIRGKHNAA